MRGKVLLLGALTGGVLLFIWGAIVNSAVPMSLDTLRPFANDEEVVSAIRRNAPDNGNYLSDKGVFVAVDVNANGSLRAPSLGPFLGVELLADVAIGLLLTIVVLSARGSSLPRPLVLAAAALAGGIAVSVSHWNWFGFSGLFTAAELLEVTLGWLLVGFALTRLVDRLTPARVGA